MASSAAKACLAPVGQGPAGSPCLTVTFADTGERLEVPAGELRRIELAAGTTREVMVSPARRYDIGAGRGRALRGEVQGGVVGLILDTRGRPLQLPAEAGQRRRALETWAQAMDLYPD